MFSWFSCIVTACLRPFRQPNAASVSSDDDDDSSTSIRESLLWFRDLQRHFLGELSYAVCQANEDVEDYSQVEIGSRGLFVGVYDGHGGFEAAQFVRNRLFNHITRIAVDNGTVSEETLREAVGATEREFLLNVDRGQMLHDVRPKVGSCCLAGVIWKGILYIANVGDSRAIVGTSGLCKRITAVQLTRDHNCSSEDIREELMAQHPNDPNIVRMERGAWRLKGVIQVSRSIGDAYLKTLEYPQFLREPLTEPVLSAEPSLYSRVLRRGDKFLIFASDGLWDHLTNQQAVEIVHFNQRTGIARKLIKAAIKEAARKARTTYRALRRTKKKDRREFHDDITVVVVFLDSRSPVSVPELSVQSFVDATAPSNFQTLHNLT